MGQPVRAPASEEFIRGFKVSRKNELLNQLCEAYASPESPRRVVQRSQGALLPPDGIQSLLVELRRMDWKENVRPQVDASGYCVLKRPYELTTQPRWKVDDPRSVRRRVWEKSEALLRGVSDKAANFCFTAIAVSKNFRGSPHVDKNDRGPQYALSLGDFDAGGELCVEESPFVVRAIETKGRLACIDGRLPHWVSGYSGERYSIIFYRSTGNEDDIVSAIHDV
mmetsp:Transcript_9761/g.14329  ORF Transcript_9761/g.14329 Transcript_9761/m.14329 type:complete len:224 (-) Transcript_9761:200-871(-)